jgi:E3 ubiquitin-protein ligase RNF115/126
MVPDAHCASCNGTFVEKIEGDVDDPRRFQDSGPPDGGVASGGGPGMENFFNLFQLLSESRPQHGPQRGNPNLPPSPERASTGGGAGFRLDIDRGPGNSRTIIIGGPPSLGGNNRRGAPSEEQPTTGNSLMAQYLLAMLSQRAGREGLADPFSGFSFLGGPEDGRMGDYVFNQEALDHIITQIMEQGSSSRPVPATEDVMEQLHREVLEEGSPLLGRDCAVCKDQFALNTEEPDDQVIVTLPCDHPFHEGCIMPWLKSSATCPVCRFQLVPQPGPRSPDTTASGSGAPPSINRATRPDSSSSGGMFGQLFNMMGGRGSGNSSSSRTNRNRPAAEEREREDVPGGWSD